MYGVNLDGQSLIEMHSSTNFCTHLRLIIFSLYLTYLNINKSKWLGLITKMAPGTSFKLSIESCFKGKFLLTSGKKDHIEEEKNFFNKNESIKLNLVFFTILGHWFC